MHGLGLDRDPRSWFQRSNRVPKVTVKPDLIERALRRP